MDATTAQQLITAKLERDVLAYIAEGRQAGDSFEAIARRLYRITGVPISSETLRRWHAAPAPPG